MSAAYLLGVDLGTTALKTVLFTPQGEVVAAASREFELDTPAPRWVECDPKVYWDAFASCIADLLSEVPGDRILALAVSSQGETLIPVDEGGRPLRKAIVWLDDRAEAEAEVLAAAFPKEPTYRVTGQPEILPAWPASKLLWLRNHEPEVFRAARQFLFLEDYLILKLTGTAVSDYSLVCSSLMLDINRKRWWDEMLQFIGVSPDRLPRLAESGTLVGNVTNTQTGLSGKTLVATGAMDQVCGMVGAANVAPGIVSETTGGALAICATTGRPVFDPFGRIPCHYHARKDTYFLLPWVQTGGLCMKWLRDELGYDSYDTMTAEAALVPPGSEGLLFLPYMAGAGAPHFNAKARGVYHGLGLGTRKAHLIRAAMESVGYVLRENIEVLQTLGVETTEIRALGGGSRSPLWNRIKADVTQRPIVTMQTEEAACLGAAILAGVGAGVFPGIEDACRRMDRTKDRYLPGSENALVYHEAYHRYIQLSAALLPLF